MTNPYRAPTQATVVEQMPPGYAAAWRRRRWLIVGSLAPIPVLFAGGMVAYAFTSNDGWVFAFAASGVLISNVCWVLLMLMRCPRCGGRFTGLWESLWNQWRVFRSTCRHCGQPAGEGDPIVGFVSRARAGRIYLLGSDDDGSYFVLSVPRRGQTVPVWTDEHRLDRARRARARYRSMRVRELSLRQFREDLLRTFEDDGVRIGLDWDGKSQSLVDVEARELRTALEG